MFSRLNSLVRHLSPAISRVPQNVTRFAPQLQHHRLVQMSAGDTKDVTYDQVKSLKDNRTVCLIDVREPSELRETGVIPGSINIPLGQLEGVLKSLNGVEFSEKFQREKPEYGTPLVFTCKAGIRSEKAMNIAQKLGYKQVHNYKGGWLDWESNLKN